MDEELVFQVTKLIAESDSIAEGYGYCQVFTMDDYKTEKGEAVEEFMGEMRKVSPVGWRDLAVKIIQLVQAEGE